MAQEPRNVLIMGAAGRDFHNFNTYYRNNKDFRVKAFTAHQIPDIDGRRYPKEIAGELYPEGIPIYAEEKLEELIKSENIDEVVFAYSDVAHKDVMHRGAIVNAAGVHFTMLGAKETMIKSNKPVIAVTAVRTGCGKSQTSRAVCAMLRDQGLRVAVIRHPMPYGDLNAQRCQRFEKLEDLTTHKCTIEEREEYEYHLERGHIVYAGVDYQDILDAAEKEADVILWDGGNNDIPFYAPDLHIVLGDPHRPGHEEHYYPGETNFRMASIIVIPKIGTAEKKNIEAVIETAKRINPTATIIKADSVVTVEKAEELKGKTVLVVEDGPTLTHGEMLYGAGIVAAKQAGVAKMLDAKEYAVGTLKDTYATYPHITGLLPAMGYGDQQIADLKDTMNAVPCEAVIVGTPFDLGRLIPDCKHPLYQVSYELEIEAAKVLGTHVDKAIKEFK